MKPSGRDFFFLGVCFWCWSCSVFSGSWIYGSRRVIKFSEVLSHHSRISSALFFLFPSKDSSYAYVRLILSHSSYMFCWVLSLFSLHCVCLHAHVCMHMPFPIRVIYVDLSSFTDSLLGKVQSTDEPVQSIHHLLFFISSISTYSFSLLKSPIRSCIHCPPFP